MNIQIRLGIVFSCSLLAVSLSGCLTAAPAHAGAGAIPSPLTWKIANFTIEPQPLAGSTERETFTALLASAATGQAARSLVRQGVAAAVEKARPEAALAGEITVVGSVRMAVALPPNVRGLTAARRQGSLAVARVQLVDARGDVVAAGEASIAWNDVRWLSGARQHRRSRPVEEVLLDGARLSVDRAVEEARDFRGARPERATIGSSRPAFSAGGGRRDGGVR